MNREIHYLYGGNGLAGIYVRTDGKDTLFAAVTDRQNSLTAVMDVATGKVEKFSYKPWGMRRNPANWSENVVTDYPARFSRGYCMHEHLPQFGLINMGGRIFDERTNQFLSPDPYRQAPESWLNCNRFGYCMGNPVMYTDPDGEWLGVDDIIAMLIGGLVNGFSQLASGNVENFGQFMSYVGVGAVGAEVSLYASPIVGGMIVGGGNAALNGVFSGNGISAQNVLMGAFMGGLTSYVGGQVSGWVSNATSSLMGNVMSPALRYITPQAIGGATSGFAVGFAFSLGLGADFKTALKEGGKGALFGFTTGVFHGLHETRIYSKEHGVNPWTGKREIFPDNDLVAQKALPAPAEVKALPAPEEPFLVTPDGVVLPKGCKIPEHFIENKYRLNDYGEEINGVFTPRIRIDQGTPPGFKGPNKSHFHINGKGKHIFDPNKWPYK